MTNFESDKSAAEFANLYREDGLTGGHVIMLGGDPLSKAAAIEALHAYPGRLQFILSRIFSALSIWLIICLKLTDFSCAELTATTGKI